MTLTSTTVFTLCAAFAAAQDEPPRTAAQILRDHDGVRMPSFSDGSDKESVRRFEQAIDDGCRRQAELAAELQRHHPDHARLPEVLSIRWAGMTNALGQADAVAAELTALLQREGLRDDVRRNAVLARAHALQMSDAFTDAERIRAVRDVIALKGGADHAAVCMLRLVERHIVDPGQQRKLLGMAMELWPDSDYGGRPAKGWLRGVDMVGKPFEPALPETNRAWFREQTAGATAPEFTVVQLWMGWVDSDGEDAELNALLALRRELGPRLRLLGLMNGDVEERLPAAKEAGVDWPQTHIADPATTACPFGLPQSLAYFVLDKELRVVGITARAGAIGKRIAQLTNAELPRVALLVGRRSSSCAESSR